MCVNYAEKWFSKARTRHSFLNALICEGPDFISERRHLHLVRRKFNSLNLDEMPAGCWFIFSMLAMKRENRPRFVAINIAKSDGDENRSCDLKFNALSAFTSHCHLRDNFSLMQQHQESSLYNYPNRVPMPSDSKMWVCVCFIRRWIAEIEIKRSEMEKYAAKQNALGRKRFDLFACLIGLECAFILYICPRVDLDLALSGLYALQQHTAGNPRAAN